MSEERQLAQALVVVPLAVVAAAAESELDAAGVRSKSRGGGLVAVWTEARALETAYGPRM